MKLHIIPELEFDGKISGRKIRKSIIDNDMEIPEEIKEFFRKQLQIYYKKSLKREQFLEKEIDEI